MTSVSSASSLDLPLDGEICVGPCLELDIRDLQTKKVKGGIVWNLLNLPVATEARMAGLYRHN